MERFRWVAMRSSTPTPATMSEIVLDANVLVGLLDQNDSLHLHSTAMLTRLQQSGDQPVMLDIMVRRWSQPFVGGPRKGSPLPRTSDVFAIKCALGSKVPSSRSCTTP